MVVNSEINILKTSISFEISLVFAGNNASYGGAIYVADDSNTEACSSGIECFVQTIAHYDHSDFVYEQSLRNIKFSHNKASKSGSELFGGLLDRCIPNQFAELFLLTTSYHNGFTYLSSISNITNNSITSEPVRLCFCIHGVEMVCSS